MHQKKFVVLIAGAPCSGKSSVEAALGKLIPGAYLVAYDKLKWQLAGFDRKRDSAVVQSLVFDLFSAVCQKGLPIFLSVYMHNKAEFEKYKNIAEQNGYILKTFRLVAPTEVLLQRFRERIARAATTGAKITLTDEKEYLDYVASPAYSPIDTPEFNSSTMQAEEIAEAIMSSL